jgi:hypothetical protein
MRAKGIWVRKICEHWFFGTKLSSQFSELFEYGKVRNSTTQMTKCVGSLMLAETGLLTGNSVRLLAHRICQQMTKNRSVSTLKPDLLRVVWGDKPYKIPLWSTENNNIK